MNPIYHPAARREADAAVEWCAEHRSPERAVRLQDKFGRAIDRIAADPRRYPLADDGPEGLEVREYAVPRTYYRFVYLILGERIAIVAVAHSSREQGYWINRLPQTP